MWTQLIGGELGLQNRWFTKMNGWCPWLMFVNPVSYIRSKIAANRFVFSVSRFLPDAVTVQRNSARGTMSVMVNDPGKKCWLQLQLQLQTTHSKTLFSTTIFSCDSIPRYRKCISSVQNLRSKTVPQVSWKNHWGSVLCSWTWARLKLSRCCALTYTTR